MFANAVCEKDPRVMHTAAGLANVLQHWRLSILLGLQHTCDRGAAWWVLSR